MKKLKELFKSRTGKITAIMCCVSAFLCMSAFAEETTTTTSGTLAGMDGITSSLQTGFTQTAGTILSVIGIAVVAVIGVVGVKVAIKSAIKFFKSMSSGS